MIGWTILIAFAGLSYFYSWWFLVGVVVLFLWKINRWYFYSSRPWRRVHFPMMRAYAGAAGVETGRAEISGGDFDLRVVLLDLLHSVNPKLSITHAELLDREFERCRKFSDEALVRSYLMGKKSAEAHKVDSIIEAIRREMHTENKGLMVRLVIAAIIEAQFSQQDRAEYLFEVFRGRAK